MWNPRKNTNPNAPPPGYNYGNTATQPQPMQQMPAQHPANYQVPPSVATPKPVAPAPSPNDQNSFIDTKISKVNAKNKVLDFSDMLVKAYDADYAQVHGSGGKNHAPNSGICLTLCDYTKGTGDASVTVKFIVDVREIDRLMCAVGGSINGTLGLSEQLKAVKDFATANGMVIGWLQGQHQPTYQELAGLQQILCAGLTKQDPENQNDQVYWSYDVQKNNPYRTTWENGKEFTPVSTLSLQYIPSRRYPWLIKVSNFMAPISRQQNGATTHNAKEAVGKKEVMFPISTEALFTALADVSHYISLWEYRMYPTVNRMCSERERRAAEKRQQRNQR